MRSIALGELGFYETSEHELVIGDHQEIAVVSKKSRLIFLLVQIISLKRNVTNISGVCVTFKIGKIDKIGPP